MINYATEKIEFNANNFINAIEDAIKNTSSSKMTNEEFKREQEKEKEVNDNIAISKKDEVLSQTGIELHPEVKIIGRE